MLSPFNAYLYQQVRAVVTGLTDEQLAYSAPAIDLRPLREVAIHAYRPVLVVACVATGKEWPPRLPQPRTADELFAQLATMHQQIEACLTGLTPEDWQRTITLPWNPSISVYEALIESIGHGLVHVGCMQGIRAFGGFPTPPEEPKPQRGQAPGKRLLILVRHSLSRVDPATAAKQWELTEEGAERCRVLARRLAPYRPTAIVSSVEPKAQETARILASELQLPWRTAENLHEHEREGMPFLDAERWQETIARFFAEPERLVFGRETALQARQRFEQALQTALAQQPAEQLIVVSHGTVLTLFAAQLLGVKPLAFWKALAMPAYLVFELPAWRCVEVAQQV
ncbi:broad specificity phosphatase PhoE [Thermosporothrix hazakensis]|uniref:Broad specificity phosphatase PhoE n=2 Tax=Thermosporothrix TaxID=768650 RepID=A0A326U5A1_THEHA|nr:histidine phosphatase family protein [Thermosporothrix hazakensis]PZW24859.1 broad specificity phosphatase PhoE [Thermosporothrix hazakensis]BBH88265.1 hypothetical protein KTC_30160 [Thermosporothrix sp. COM3]GCE46452.1 hypothetical protein KTH_13210 [Thermosporothrix hazakensis]